MKKIFPVALLAICIFGFFAGQIIFDLVNTNASLSTKEKAKFEYINKTFKTLTLDGMAKGQKVEIKNIKEPIVVVNFWASWCMPCLKEFPSLAKLKSQLGKENVRILAINGDDKNVSKAVDKIKKKLKRDLDFQFFTDNNKLLSKFKINKLPTTLTFVNGEIVEYKTGLKDFLDTSYISMLKKGIAKKKVATPTKKP